MKKTLILGLYLLSTTTFAQDILPESNPDHEFAYEDIETVQFSNYEEAANWADLVAVVQVVNIDYQKTRKLNAKGQAFLNILVPYKGAKKNELVIVNESGFEDDACYYPDRENEGARYLVFLKQTTNEMEYVGFKPLCQLQVLINELGRYALRYPLDTDLALPEDAPQAMRFADPHAVIDATEWSYASREKHMEKFASELSEDSDLFQKYYYLTYTQGVDLGVVRKLMNIPIKQRIRSKQL
ncbi:hypothetical protein [Marinicella sp. W31]|uniref:hypothetical protein n=1 Tax=Marinicella sp. W31 TaxID=3023713 RepID=UPI003757C57D